MGPSPRTVIRSEAYTEKEMSISRAKTLKRILEVVPALAFDQAYFCAFSDYPTRADLNELLGLVMERDAVPYFSNEYVMRIIETMRGMK